MSEKYPVIDPDDLVGGDEDKKEIFKLINEKLESHMAFPICGYKNTEEVKKDIDKTLNEIVDIFLYFPEEIEDKLNIKDTIKNKLIRVCL